MVIANRFPQPPSRVIEAFKRLRVLGSGDLGAVVGLEKEPGHVPRPWDPATCDDELRLDVWTWCDEVASWINREFAWRGFTGIPPCWPRHPYLAHELPLLACMRHVAGEAKEPRLLEEWMRLILPAFMERTAARTGEGCHNEHTEWPGAAAFHRFVDKDVVAAREGLFGVDAK